MDRKIGALTLREVTGLVLLLVLLLGGVLSSWYMGRQHENLSRQMEDCAWLALSGQLSNARKMADAACMEWENGQRIWAILADHTPMEEIDDMFAELRIYGAAGEQTEFARTCSALSTRMAAMGNAHALRWWNVL